MLGSCCLESARWLCQQGRPVCGLLAYVRVAMPASACKSQLWSSSGLRLHAMLLFVDVGKLDVFAGACCCCYCLLACLLACLLGYVLAFSACLPDFSLTRSISRAHSLACSRALASIQSFVLCTLQRASVQASPWGSPPHPRVPPLCLVPHSHATR